MNAEVEVCLSVSTVYDKDHCWGGSYLAFGLYFSAEARIGKPFGLAVGVAGCSCWCRPLRDILTSNSDVSSSQPEELASVAGAITKELRASKGKCNAGKDLRSRNYWAIEGLIGSMKQFSKALAIDASSFGEQLDECFVYEICKRFKYSTRQR